MNYMILRNGECVLMTLWVENAEEALAQWKVQFPEDRWELVTQFSQDCWGRITEDCWERIR